MGIKKKIAIVGHGLFLSALPEQLIEKTSVEAEKLTINEIVEQGNTMYINNYRDLGYAEYDYGTTKKQRNQTVIPVRNSADNPKIQNNEPCLCGSGNKYKKCCKKM